MLGSSMQTLRILPRFCGPPTSANGGYFAGLVATLAERTLMVRLRQPPPLDTALTVSASAGGALQVLQAQSSSAKPSPRCSSSIPRVAPHYLEAVEASRHYAGFR